MSMKNAGLTLALTGMIIPFEIYADCLEVKEKSLQERQVDYGLVTAEWSAQVLNKCESPYDGTIRIRLLDSDDKVLQATTDIVILQANEKKESRRSITIPAEGISDVDRIEVEIEERERPL